MHKKNPFSYLKAQQKYSGQFIARDNRRVIAAGKTLGALMKNLQRRGITYSSEIVVGHVPPWDAICIYAAIRIST